MEFVAERNGVVEGQLEDRAGEKGQRDARGKFARGNTCGRGNSSGRALVVMRFMREAATDEKIREVCEKVVDKAAAGGIEAAKLMFRFLMGKEALRLEAEAVGLEEEVRKAPAGTCSDEGAGMHGTIERRVDGEYLVEEPSPCPCCTEGTGLRAGDGGGGCSSPTAKTVETAVEVASVGECVSPLLAEGTVRTRGEPGGGSPGRRPQRAS